MRMQKTPKQAARARRPRLLSSFDLLIALTKTRWDNASRGTTTAFRAKTSFPGYTLAT
jgi:hypothetical protein